jgi:DNA-cytosine methyltransferase
MDGINVLSLFDGMSCGRIALERAGIKVNNYYASEIDKHAIKVTQHNYPDTIQLGSVTEIKGTDLPKIDLLIGGSPCFVSGTKIITSYSLKPIEDVRVGDEVLTHKGLYRKVLRVGGKTSEIYELQSQSGTLTETTENHPYYVRKRSKVWNSENRSYEFKFNEPEFVKIKDLTKDHYLATPILKSAKNPMGLTEDECFLIGLYIGDGHTRKDFRKTEGRGNHRHWQLIISVGEHKKDLFSEKVKLKHSLHRHTKSTYRAVFSSKRLVSYVEEQCGCSAHTKHFGKGILDLPVHLLKKVIEGYLFADGSFRGNVHRVTTVSRSLVESLTLAVAKTFRTTTCVEYTTRPKTTEILGRVVNQSDTWTVSFRENHPKQSRSRVLGDFIWNPIKKLIKTDKKKPVFNLEVEEDNSYVANNHVVHNCQGFSFAGKQLNFEDPRSKLFFEFVRLLKECKPKYFLLENVKMKKEYQDVITEHLGVEPIEINSNLLSAQNRKRIYWTNIPGVTIPNDKKILLKDIVHENNDEVLNIELPNFNINPSGNGMNGDVYSIEKSKSRTLTTNKGEGQKISIDIAEYIVPFEKTLQILDKEVQRGKVGYFRKDSQANRVYYIHDKAITLTGEAGGGAAKMGQYLFGCITPDRIEKRQNGQRFNDGKKFYTLTAQDKHGVLIEGYIRKLTPIECERLQTVPDNYSAIVSNSQRYKMLGNGWTVDVIAHIFRGLSLALRLTIQGFV